MTQIKICGITRFREVEYLNELLPDYLGFVFAPSRRKVDFSKAFLLRSELDPKVKAVGVFVNEEIDFIRRCCECRIIDAVQLHGNEDNEYLRKLKRIVHKPVIRALRIRPDMDIAREIERGMSGLGSSDFLLFDTCSPGIAGGTGTAFDWSCLPSIPFPFFLAGGLHAQNLNAALEKVHPYGVDISSGAEEDGVKHREKIEQLIRMVRSNSNAVKTRRKEL